MAHKPTKTTRDTVSLHAMVGTPQELIAELLGIDSKTLRKHYREELDHALAKANATIGGSLFNKAKGGDSSAQMFWLKTRAGWKETNKHDLISSDGSMSPKEPTLIKLVGVKTSDD